MKTLHSDKERQVADLLGETEESVVEAVAGTDIAKDKIRKTIIALEQSNADRFLSDVELHELVETAFNERWPVAERHIGNITRMLSGIISQGNRDGEFSIVDCDLAALVVRDACLRFWHPRIMIEFAQEAKPSVDLMIDVCLAAFAQGVIRQERSSDDKILRRLFPYLN
jgi:hypothetical protein